MARPKKLTADEVAQTAAEVVKDFAGPRYRFEVVPAGVSQDNGWWYVPVISETVEGRQLPHLFLSSVLGNIETELEKRLKTYVLLIPALPDPVTS